MATMNSKALCLSFAIVLSVLSRLALTAGEGSKEADKISGLPGQPPDAEGLSQYSGYINVDDKDGKSLFYYFVEASADAAQKPLVLWLNGGPGCSSLGIGALQEVGPFRVDTDGKTLCKNKYAWNTVANMLFLDSPVGVGFSYAVNTAVYNTMEDNMTAHDSYMFMQKWLDRFPEYKTRDLYIVGESYAGHFVPELAVAIHVFKVARPNDTPMNLKGIAIGNGILEYALEQNALYEYLWQHAFISDSAHTLIAQSCRNAEDESPVCQGAKDSAYGHIGNIDIYNVYATKCHDKRVKPSASKCVDLADPCAQYYVEAYLNQPEVQKAVHVDGGWKGPWTRCRTYNLNRFGNSPKATMLPHIKALATGGIRVWIFSGDLDAMVPVISTRQSVEKLGLGIVEDWRPWTSGANKEEVAGYVIEYRGLVFATLRGSGHMAPIDQPERVLDLFASFLKDQPLPKAVGNAE